MNKKQENSGSDNDLIKIKRKVADLYLEIAEVFEHRLTNKMLTTSFNLAKEDVGNNKFTWEELFKAMRDSMRHERLFPPYSVFYKSIMAQKNKEQSQ